MSFHIPIIILTVSIFGDEIDSIRTFDIENQLSVDSQDENIRCVESCEHGKRII